MDKAKAKIIRERASAHLATLGEEMGLAITLRSGSYDDGQITFKVEFAEVGEDGVVKSKEASDFERYCEAYGLTPDHLGAEFSVGATRYAIVGAKPRATRYPILAKGSDGKTYKFNDADVRSYLGVTA